REQRVFGPQRREVAVVEHVLDQELADRGLGGTQVHRAHFGAFGSSSARRSTLPLLVRGSSFLNSTDSGTMYRGSVSAQCCRSSSAVTSTLALHTTTARNRLVISSSGT